MNLTTLTKAHLYTIDPAHSTIRFWVRHMMIAKVHGEMDDVNGSVTLDPEDPSLSSVDIRIATASLTTGNDTRYAHLKSADFLDVENSPAITFKSKEVRPSGGSTFSILGDLTIRGTTREITLKAELTPEVKSPFGGYKIGASATAVIDREHFGITWNQALETGGVLVGKEINIQIDVELDRPE